MENAWNIEIKEAMLKQRTEYRSFVLNLMGTR
jgi:hypothetical protein